VDEQMLLTLVGILALSGLVAGTIWMLWWRYRSGYVFHWRAIGRPIPEHQRVYRDKEPLGFWARYLFVVALFGWLCVIGLIMVYHLTLRLFETVP